jgi:hypothetical protein
MPGAIWEFGIDPPVRPCRPPSLFLDSLSATGWGGGQIARLSPLSWPGLTRPSTLFSSRYRKDVDARVKPGHDEFLDG